MRRPTSSTTDLIDEDDQSDASDEMEAGNALHCDQDYDEGEDDIDAGDRPTRPVRKGTLSKDISSHNKTVSMERLMYRANVFGIVLFLAVPFAIAAFVTGNLKALAGIVACSSALASILLIGYRATARLRPAPKKDDTRQVMLGLALYVTTPLCAASSLCYFMSSS
mmetsp:Transcript_56918/g.128968  ORF Transcript_56918/g.128968 Transcript_56918/m.128968 type:complete len:166 (+) Transcript_56918:77-574(+)